MDASRVVILHLLLVTQTASSLGGYDLLFDSNPRVPRALLITTDGTPVKEIASTKLSFCLFANISGRPGSDPGHLVSFASEDAEETNEVVFEINIRNKYTALTVHANAAIVKYVPPLNEWVHICVSWESSSGQTHFYLGGRHFEYPGLCTGCSIGGNGYFILGQDQDSYNGDFEVIDGFQGRMTEFYLWNRVLTPKQMKDVRHCKSVSDGGMIVNWETAAWKFEDGIDVSPTTSPCRTTVREKRCFPDHMQTSALDIKNFQRTTQERAGKAIIPYNILKDVSFCHWIYIASNRAYLYPIFDPIYVIDSIVSHDGYVVTLYCMNGKKSCGLVRMFTGRLQFDQWHHVCVTFGGTKPEGTLYLAGKAVTTQTADRRNFSFAEGHRFYVQQIQQDTFDEKHPTQGFTIKITEFNLWDRLITADEVEDVYCESSLQGNIFNWKKPNWKICPPHPVKSPKEQLRTFSGMKSTIIHNVATDSGWKEEKAFTFCAWFYAGKRPHVYFEHLILGLSNGADIRLATGKDDGRLMIKMNNEWKNLTTRFLTHDDWQHGCVVWSNVKGDIMIYWNAVGQKQETFQANYTIPPIKTVEVRQLQYTSGNESDAAIGFQYKITDVQWWNRTLSETEVEELWLCSQSIPGSTFNGEKADWEEPTTSAL